MSNSVNKILKDKYKDKIKSIENSDALLIDLSIWSELAEFIKNDKETNFD